MSWRWDSCSAALLLGAGMGAGPCRAPAAPTRRVGMAVVAGCTLGVGTGAQVPGPRKGWTSPTPVGVLAVLARTRSEQPDSQSSAPHVQSSPGVLPTSCKTPPLTHAAWPPARPPSGPALSLAGPVLGLLCPPLLGFGTTAVITRQTNPQFNAFQHSLLLHTVAVHKHTLL